MSTLIIPVGSSFTLSPLLTTMNLYEHELLLLLPENLLNELKTKTNSAVPEAKHKAVTARMAELAEWVERGQTLVVLGLSPAAYLWTDQRQNYRASFGDFPLFNNVKLTAKSGTSTRVASAFSALLGPLVSSIDYQYVLTGSKLTPLMFVRTTGKTSGPPDVIAAAVPVGGRLRSLRA